MRRIIVILEPDGTHERNSMSFVSNTGSKNPL